MCAFYGRISVVFTSDVCHIDQVTHLEFRFNALLLSLCYNGPSPTLRGHGLAEDQIAMSQESMWAQYFGCRRHPREPPEGGSLVFYLLQKILKFGFHLTTSGVISVRCEDFSTVSKWRCHFTFFLRNLNQDWKRTPNSAAKSNEFTQYTDINWRT